MRLPFSFPNRGEQIVMLNSQNKKAKFPSVVISFSRLWCNFDFSAAKLRLLQQCVNSSNALSPSTIFISLCRLLHTHSCQIIYSHFLELLTTSSNTFLWPKKKINLIKFVMTTDSFFTFEFDMSLPNNESHHRCIFPSLTVELIWTLYNYYDAPCQNLVCKIIRQKSVECVYYCKCAALPACPHYTIYSSIYLPSSSSFFALLCQITATLTLAFHTCRLTMPPSTCQNRESRSWCSTMK